MCHPEHVFDAHHIKKDQRQVVAQCTLVEQVSFSVAGLGLRTTISGRLIGSTQVGYWLLGQVIDDNPVMLQLTGRICGVAIRHLAPMSTDEDLGACALLLQFGHLSKFNGGYGKSQVPGDQLGPRCLTGSWGPFHEDGLRLGVILTELGQELLELHELRPCHEGVDCGPILLGPQDGDLCVGDTVKGRLQTFADL